MSRLTLNAPPQSPNDAPESDSRWLCSLEWDEGPDELIAAARDANSSRFAKGLKRHLARIASRKKIGPAKLAVRFPGHKQIAFEVYDLFVSGEDNPHETDDLESRLIRLVARLDALSRKTKGLGSSRLLRHWKNVWEESQRVADSLSDGETPLVRILALEALLASGIIFGGLEGMKERRKQARRGLATELDAWTDTDGTPHADLLTAFPAWLASIVRSTGWAKAMGFRLWTSSDSDRIDGLLRSAVALSRPDGSLALGDDVDLRPVLVEGIKHSGWKSHSPARRLLARLAKHNALSELPGRHPPLHKSDKTSPPVLQSDWAKVAVLRDRWRPNSDTVAVTHQKESPRIEFNARGRTIIRGDWQFRIQIDGQPVELTADWEAVSWFSDRDADYLELQWSNELGIVACRQILLARGTHQLVLADSVSTPKRTGARIDLETTLPLAANVSAIAQRPLRELRIDAAGLSVRCLPVALPMDRIAHAAGTVEATDKVISIRQSGVGGVYAPILFDWHPKRREVHADWRTLTVTEDRRRLNGAEASAHRVRLGNEQLLVYRNLSGSKAMRAVLGYHHGNETAIGRFSSEGAFDPLVLVE